MIKKSSSIKAIFLSGLITLSAGCAGKPITSRDQFTQIWNAQVACMSQKLGTDISDYVRSPQNVVVDFEISNCGKKRFLHACAWVFPSFNGYAWRVGTKNDTPVYFTVGEEVELFDFNNKKFINIVLYEKGRFRLDLVKHENIHVILGQYTGSVDPQHESKFFDNDLCQ